MTAAPAVAPAPAPVAPLPARAVSQPSADRVAFATVLDSLPSAAAKAGAPAAEEQAHPSNESPQEQPTRGQMAHHSLPNDSALFASLPFAVRAASMMEERPQAADNSPSVPSAAVTGPKPEASSASIAAGISTSNVGRLIGERAFHSGASASGGAFASQTLTTGPPFEAAEAISATSFADATPSIENPPAAASIAPHPGGAATNRVSPTRTAAPEAARTGRKSEGSAPPPATRASGSASPPAPAGSNAKATDGRTPDPTPSAAPSPTQTSLFGAQLSAPFGASAPFELDASATKVAGGDVGPLMTPLAAGSGSSTPPVKEIDVDLSPGGLENVSMTMRLAGDKLSVVIRAASSQTLGSIEGARDAITDRLAAIGQPLDSLIVKQAGVNTNANTNGNPASSEDGSPGDAGGSTQGASEWGGSNDALSRRGAGRDRNF